MSEQLFWRLVYFSTIVVVVFLVALQFIIFSILGLDEHTFWPPPTATSVPTSTSDIPPQRMTKFSSAATVTAVGLTCKAVLNLGLCSMTVRGLPNLLDALQSSERDEGRGVVTGKSRNIYLSAVTLMYCFV